MFFWVFPRRQIEFCRRFGTLCQVHLQRLDVEYEVNISQMLNASVFGNTADIYLVRHAGQYLLNAIFAYYCLLAANQDNYVRELYP
jgi:hypothetical protein